MKRFMLVAIAFVMVFALAACGGDNDPAPSGDNDPGASQQQPSDAPDDSTPSGGDTPSSTQQPAQNESEESGDYTVAEFLAYYGMTEDDITPEHFVEFAPVEMDGNTKPGEIGSTGYIKITVDKEATGEPQVRAWYEKIYAKMQALSTDGKIHGNALTIGTDNDEESSLEDLFSNPLWEDFPGTMWAYPYEGGMRINVATRYDYESGVYSMSFMVFGS